ncbi:MAG TPA: hypothetical protein VD908_08590 [Cytophagales bacterium]|nr:hypothetical protein [Cytophagales bacterium]
MEEDMLQEKKNNIKLWIHRQLKLDSNCVILLSEVNCREDCEDKETIVLVMKDCENDAKVFRLKKCMSEISEENVANLLANNVAFEKEHFIQPCSKLIKKLF